MSSNERLIQQIEINELEFVKLHRSQMTQLSSARLFASPIKEVATWNFAGEIRSTATQLDRLITEVERFFSARSTAPCFRINCLSTPEEAEERLIARNYALNQKISSMIYSAPVVPKLSKQSFEELEIEVVKSDSQIKQFTEVQFEGFELPQDWRDWFLETNSRNARLQNQVYYIAKLADQPAGVSLALFTEGGVCGIYAVAVLAKFRGRGVATALLQRIAQEAQASGHFVVTLSTAADGAAERVFKQAGFKRFFTSSYYQPFKQEDS